MTHFRRFLWYLLSSMHVLYVLYRIFFFLAQYQPPQPSDLYTVCYTSGTTGKSVILSIIEIRHYIRLILIHKYLKRVFFYLTLLLKQILDFQNAMFLTPEIYNCNWIDFVFANSTHWLFYYIQATLKELWLHMVIWYQLVQDYKLYVKYR